MGMGLIYVILAAGLVLILSVSRIFLIAYGQFYMIGAYLGYQLVSIWQINFWPALILAGLGTGIVGMAAEFLFLRRIYGRAREGGFQILLTFCFILIIDDLVKLIWGTEYKSIPRPSGFSGAVQFGDIFLPVERLVI